MDMENKLNSTRSRSLFQRFPLIWEYRRVSKETYIIVKVRHYCDRGTSA